MTSREKPFDRARRQCIDRLKGVWTRREIELAMEAIRDESDARAFADPVGVVNDWILAERSREAREKHREAREKDGRALDDGGGGVVKLDLRRAAG